MLLEVPQAELANAVKQLQDKGYSSFLVEPYTTHDQKDERYLSFTHDRSGYHFCAVNRAALILSRTRTVLKLLL